MVVALVAAVVLLGGAAAAYVATDVLKPSHPVPHLVGDSRAAATAALSREHFELVVSGTQYDSRIPSGAVIAQQPSTGKLVEGSKVTVLLSLGPQPVPVTSLAGDTEQAAEQVLSGLGLKVGRVNKVSSMTVPEGIVISSTPDSGTVLPGASVDLDVSTGKPQVTVPALTSSNGASYTAAQTALSAVGLGANESLQYSDTVAAGHVIALSPGPEATVTIGTVISVAVSRGPHLVVVPNVATMSVAAASQAVTNAGLSVSGVSGNPLSTVTGANPAVGTTVHFGSSVELITG